MKTHKESKYLFFVIILLVAAFFMLSFFVDKIFKSPSLEIVIPEVINDSVFSGIDEGSSPGSKVNFIMFGDTKCPFTSNMVDSINSVYEYYKDEVNFVYKHFPLHIGSEKAAEAIECASDQGFEWEFIFLVFENPDNQGIADLKKYSSDLGLDAEAFGSCLDSGIKASVVEKDKNEALMNNVKGTPTFFVGGLKLVGFQTEGGLGYKIREALAK